MAEFIMLINLNNDLTSNLSINIKHNITLIFGEHSQLILIFFSSSSSIFTFLLSFQFIQFLFILLCYQLNAYTFYLAPPPSGQNSFVML